MSATNILNFMGLLLNMAGAYLMYYYSAKVSSKVILYTRAESDSMHKKDLHKNKMIRLGMLLLFIGFIFQMIALLGSH